MGALAFYDHRTSFRWFIAFLILILIAFVLNDTAARYFDNDIDVEFTNAMFLMNIMGVSIMVYVIQFYFVGKQSEMKRIVEERNKEISDSISYARTIQTAILPSEKLTRSLLLEHFILYKTKDIVSGDFYWVYQTNNKVIYIAADCTGHGVPGAFMSMIGNSLLNEIIIEKGITEADKILNELRKAIINTLGQTGASGESRDGMDIALCVWHKDTNKPASAEALPAGRQGSAGRLEFAGANNPLYLIRNGELIETKADKQPIGYEQGKDQPFTKHEIQLQKGDTIYIFSDGYQDQSGGPRNKKFMKKQFRQLFLDIQGKSMQEQKEILDNTIEAWKGDLEQVDDILVIGIEV